MPRSFEAPPSLLFRLGWIMLTLLASHVSPGQSSLSAEQVDRLADAGRVYGYLRYFHPFLQYKRINLDSAFALSVEAIIQARSKREYARSLGGFLAAFQDDLTRATYPDEQSRSYRPRPTTYRVKDSLLYISMNDATDDSYEQVEEALKNSGKVKGVIFDMRKPLGSPYSNRISAGQIVDWSTSYFQGALLPPSLRTVGYVGLPPETTFRSYEVHFKQTRPSVVQGSAKRPVPSVFVVDHTEALPRTAIALQQLGKSAIVQQAGKPLLGGVSVNFYIQDSVLVKIRTAETVGPDGALALIHPDATFLPGENPEAAITQAQTLLARGIARPTSLAGSPPGLTRFAEAVSDTGAYPSLGYRMLAAAKIFAAIDHFFPNKHLMDGDWEAAYRQSIPAFVNARDALHYRRAVAELYARIQDSHGFITTSGYRVPLGLNPVIQGRGTFVPPIFTRLVEGQVVVWGLYDEALCRTLGIRKGDIVLSIDGQDPLRQIEAARRYQPASTPSSQTFLVGSSLLFGKEGQVIRLKLQGPDGKAREVALPPAGEVTGSVDDYALKMLSVHSKPTYGLLTPDIGYADLTSPLQQKDLDSLFLRFRNTKAIVFDMRGYPHTSGEYRSRLAGKRSIAIAQFITPAPGSPHVRNLEGFESFVDAEQMHSAIQRLNYTYQGPVYPGRIVLLIDESAISAAEHTGLTLKAISKATFVGSPTGGADGSLTNFTIPGQITLWFSGARVAHPDGKPLQRIGLQPDVLIRPTIRGMQAGRDEVLERAVRYLKTGK